MPADFSNLPAGDEYAPIRNAVPLRKASQPAPQLVFAKRPTELVVTDGEPATEAIAGASGLKWVTNTESPLFELGSQWYLSVAGRWFATADLANGTWSFVNPLPDAFSAIPPDHPRAVVRASVPGTVEARMAALEASIPRPTRVRAGAAPGVDATYAGNPKFELIPGTQIARAVNSGFDVLLYEDKFYLCHAAGWYVADSPLGPWRATADVPPAFYTIPAESPSYPVTDVEVSESGADEITYTSTDAYDDGVYVAYGVAWYGTGWYYPPYIYGPIYYPFWGSYGHGSWYNPATGRYGSRSVWYGPYGGYSYTQGYNPQTGRYGYVESTRDSDQWVSFGQAYNPRTGVGVTTERTRDFETGTSTVQREITAPGGAVTANTVRNNGRSATAVEGSGGGEALSVSSQGHDRATVAQSGSGDVYAGYNGNIYKKTGSGWEKLDNGYWKPAQSSAYVERPRAPPPKVAGTPAAATPPAMTTQSAASAKARADADARRRNEERERELREREQREQRDRDAREREQLERDYEARERGDRQFRQRAVSRRGGGSRR